MSAPEIASRVAAAILGGYAVAFTLTAMLALLLPLPPRDAATAATLPAFAIHVAAALWAFAARSAARAWLGLSGVAALGLAVAALAW